jgi:leukemia factor-related protein
MALIPTVVGTSRQFTSSLTINGQTNPTEALHDTDGKSTSHRSIGIIGKPLSVKVEEGGAMNLSIKDSPRSDMSKTNGVHVNGIPLPLLDGRAINSGSTPALRSNPGLPYLLNTDSNVSSASMSDLESEGGQENGGTGMNGVGQDNSDMNMSNDAADKKRRRKQTSVPPASKDQRYWARRLKNNEAAKRSRDMRIQREKIIFDENTRLEGIVKDFKTDKEKLTTENKELKLKMQFILEENARLQDIIRNIQVQQQEQQQLDE